MAAKTAYQEAPGEAGSTLLAKPTRAKMEVSIKSSYDPRSGAELMGHFCCFGANNQDA